MSERTLVRAGPFWMEPNVCRFCGEGFPPTDLGVEKLLAHEADHQVLP